MNLVDYILKASGNTENLIVTNTPIGMGMYHDISEWSRTNKGYILVVPSVYIEEEMLRDGCEFEYVITFRMLDRLIKGSSEPVDDRFSELYDTSRIILICNKTFLHLKKLHFKINITTYRKRDFEITRLNYDTGTYWVETTEKPMFDFGGVKSEWMKMKTRENSLKILFDGEK